jgi:hypothetical protein
MRIAPASPGLLAIQPSPPYRNAHNSAGKVFLKSLIRDPDVFQKGDTDARPHPHHMAKPLMVTAIYADPTILSSTVLHLQDSMNSG